MAKAIWQDTYITVPIQNSPLKYRIEISGTGEWQDENGVVHNDPPAIFYGKAWAKPTNQTSTDTNYEININKICQDYLSNNIGDFRSVVGLRTVEHPSAAREFVVINDENETVLGRFTFVYDWSYDNSVVYDGTTVMSHPINGRWADGMYAFRTYYDNGKVKTDISQLPVAGYTEVECSKGEWALYYLNRYGGWDAFLIEGQVVRKDAYTRYNIEKAYNNNFTEFGKQTYNTQIVPSYTITTGWLNDRQSDILAANLFPSTRVFLHRIGTDEVYNVVMNDADATYKNHNNNGRKLINYTINVIASQTQENIN